MQWRSNPYTLHPKSYTHYGFGAQNVDLAMKAQNLYPTSPNTAPTLASASFALAALAAASLGGSAEASALMRAASFFSSGVIFSWASVGGKNAKKTHKMTQLSVEMNTHSPSPSGFGFTIMI